MKQKFLLFLFITGFVAMTFAQGIERWGRQAWQAPPEKLTVSGTMIVANGRPALKSGDDTYLVAGIQNLIGFVDGFKEGAQVTVEGSALTISPNANVNVKFLVPTKLTFNGKTYDFDFPLQGFAQGRIMPRGNDFNFNHDRWMQMQRHPGNRMRLPFRRNP